jgi:16S rRNA (cytosine967-C5)-methyltransferase
MPVDRVRDAAVDVLLRVLEGDAYLDRSLDKTLRRKEDLGDRGRRFLTMLAYGTVRHLALCDYVLAPLLHQPLAELPGPIRTILRMGVFQGLFLNQVTRPALVHTSVDLAKRRGHAGTARLVNAVLRRLPSSLDAVNFPSREDDPVAHLAARYSLPSWLAARWVQDFGLEKAFELAVASSEEAPTQLRMNLARFSAETIREQLEKAGFLVDKRTPIPEELTILDGPPPAKVKLFQKGAFVLQDGASMLPAHLMEPQGGERILDMAAAPGGKTTHLAQLAGGQATIVAMDIYPWRLALAREAGERLGLERIYLACGDGRAAPFTGGFERILVDAPCSGLGTLRRHPDLKWRMNETLIEELGVLQLELLRSAIELCKNGGLVVYSVCTITARETTELIRVLLEGGRVQLEDGPEWLDQWKIGTGQYRTLPEKGGMDGFFLTRLRKVS